MGKKGCSEGEVSHWKEYIQNNAAHILMELTEK